MAEEKAGSRPSWEEYFIGIAEAVSRRSTCDRAYVGAVVVKGKRILATGYNGSVSGLPHCSELGHEMVDGHCVRTIHAEMNAMVMAAKHGISIDGADMFITHFPCYSCFKALANVGIKRIYYKNAYRIDDKILDMGKALGMEFIKLS
ncbi:tRNA-specific adenosine deaminase [uncultured archaeon]|nr:tRNA-specific adenosine deaminase [uncultured archaeon]